MLLISIARSSFFFESATGNVILIFERCHHIDRGHYIQLTYTSNQAVFKGLSTSSTLCTRSKITRNHLRSTVTMTFTSLGLTRAGSNATSPTMCYQAALYKEICTPNRKSCHNTPNLHIACLLLHLEYMHCISQTPIITQILQQCEVMIVSSYIYWV